MNACRLSRCSPMPAIAAAAMVMLLIGVNTSTAGIVAPPQIGFEAKDLERSLGDSQSGSSSAPRDSRQFPNDSEQDHQQGPLGLLKGTLPASQSSSSSSSSSSTSGPSGSGAALAFVSGAVAVTDDLSLGRLAEELGLFLPDPPGAKLLRPPRA